MRKRHGAFKGKENVGRVLVLYTCSTKWVITAIIKFSISAIEFPAFSLAHRAHRLSVNNPAYCLGRKLDTKRQVLQSSSVFAAKRTFCPKVGPKTSATIFKVENLIKQ